MQKILYCALLVLMSHSIAWAKTCEGGTIISGVNGQEYCVSNVQRLNWWSAITWCQGQGRELISLDDCAASGDFYKEGKCTNFKDKLKDHPRGEKAYYWTQNVSSKYDAFKFYPPTLEVVSSGKSINWNPERAICK